MCPHGLCLINYTNISIDHHPCASPSSSTVDTMLNRSVIRRWSHVGRRLITLTKEIQAIKLVPKATAKPTAYGVTPIVENVVLRGPLGELAFPIHQGLLVKESPSDIEGERILRVELDNDLFPRLDKQERKFVRSMWGTTASLLRQNAHGVSEVHAILLSSYCAVLSRDTMFP